MFWQRVLTALILAPLVVAAVLWLPNPWFAAVLAGVLLVTADEGARMLIPGAMFARVAAVLLLIGGMGVLWFAIEPGPIWHLLLAAGALGWLLLTLLLFMRRAPVPVVGQPQPLLLLLLLALLLVAWVGLVLRRGQGADGPVWVLLLLITIWLADSLAYFAGRQWGKGKMAPMLSPGKTWAGFFGALAAGPVVALAAYSFGLPVAPLGLMLLLLLTVLVSIAGDLFESLLKRRSGVKDSGQLLPGHGGMYDRIDSLIAATAVFVVGLDMLEVLR